MTVVAEGLELRRVYWYYGDVPKHLLGHVAVDDPSTSGWSCAFVVPGEKNSTLFDPYSFKAWTVPNRCDELKGSKDVEWRPDYWRELLNRNWEQFQRLNLGPDLDTAAVIFKRLGLPIPHRRATVDGFESKQRGGKVVAKALAKPVKRKGKRGDFLAWFLEGDSHARPVREAMAHFGMTRSNVLSYLFILQKEHGIGYVLTGDLATVQLPEGVKDPFMQAEEKKTNG